MPLAQEEFVAIELDEILSETEISDLNSSDTIIAAYREVLQHILIDTLHQPTKASLSIWQAIKAAFYQDEHFSFKQTAILTASLALGCTAAIFCIKPAGDSTDELAHLFKKYTGLTLSGQILLRILMQTANTSANAGTSILTAFSMFETYSNQSSATENLLKFYDPKKKQTGWLNIYGRKLFDLVSAIATNIPTYLLSLFFGQFIAILTALANVSLSWRGISSLGIKKMHPAQQVEVAYLNEQIELFLTYSISKQIKQLDQLIQLYDADANETEKKFYGFLLSLSQLDKEKSAQIKIDPNPSASRVNQFAINGIIGLCVGNELMFSERSGVITANMFHDPLSPSAITTGLTAALLSLLPCIGFGYLGGKGAGQAFTSNNVPLQHLFAPRTRQALKWLVGFVALSSGGTSFSLAYAAANDFTGIAKIANPLKDIVELIFAGSCYVGGAIEFSYYFFCLLDEILLYFARRCGDQSIQRVFEFVLKARQFQGLLGEIKEEHYLSILKWKLIPSLNIDGTKDTDLSDLLCTLLASRLSDTDYQTLRKTLMDEKNYLKSRAELLSDDFIHPLPEKSSAVKTSLKKYRELCLFSCGERYKEITNDQPTLLSKIP
jgi:hypothetical protein